ncbi:GNAT family N-acetyltransferase [Angustibacter luteus]|uniref:GNAT family N-acetyltransferase n=1 Tax=Angustibacter luteus TaxID=658456 RepID=A0ABW1JHL1_9ACTN
MTEPEVRSDLLLRLESFYDAVPRQGARAELIGPLVLFVREGAGWPYYARPVRPDVQVSGDDVRDVLGRMDELGVPHQLEWVNDLTPSLAQAVQDAGLTLQLCPLMVLEPADLVVLDAPGVSVSVMDADDPDLALADACAHVAFGAGIGTAVGEGGVAERDASAAELDPARVERLRAGIRSGEQVRAVARTDVGPVASGGYQHAAGVAEVVGIGTLPISRRRGIGAALAGVLAREAFARGEHTVFLSAQDEDVARVYERVGFRRTGTSGIAEP